MTGAPRERPPFAALRAWTTCTTDSLEPGKRWSRAVSRDAGPVVGSRGDHQRSRLDGERSVGNGMVGARLGFRVMTPMGVKIGFPLASVNAISKLLPRSTSPRNSGPEGSPQPVRALAPSVRHNPRMPPSANIALAAGNRRLPTVAVFSHTLLSLPVQHSLPARKIKREKFYF